MSNNNGNNNSGSDRAKQQKSTKKMSKFGKIQMCSPYGMSVTCICDARGRIFRCMFPGNNFNDIFPLVKLATKIGRSFKELILFRNNKMDYLSCEQRILRVEKC